MLKKIAAQGPLLQQKTPLCRSAANDAIGAGTKKIAACTQGA